MGKLQLEDIRQGRKDARRMGNHIMDSNVSNERAEAVRIVPHCLTIGAVDACYLKITNKKDK